MCLETLSTGLKMIDLRGHMPRFTLKTSSICSGMQGIYAQLTGGLNLAVGVEVFKASMID